MYIRALNSKELVSQMLVDKPSLSEGSPFAHSNKYYSNQEKDYFFPLTEGRKIHFFVERRGERSRRKKIPDPAGL